MFQGERVHGIGHIAEDGSHPEEERKTAEQILAELHPLRCGPGRRQSVRSIAGKHLLGLGSGQALERKVLLIISPSRSFVIPTFSK